MRLASALSVIIWAALSMICANNCLGDAFDRPYKSGELLVKYKDCARPEDKSALQSAANVRNARAISNSRIERVVLDPGTSVEEAINIYAADPNVEIVEPNYIIQAQITPNDSSFGQQWGLHNTGQYVSGYAGTSGMDIDARSAWNLTTGSNSVIVAVVDTGCDVNHPDLSANLWTNTGEIADDGIDNDGNGYIDDVHGWDFSDDDNDPNDASGHGSHIAGIIAAASNNNRGVAGVAWQTRIMPVRFLSAYDQGTTADAISAIQYAVNNGATIINCSWGGAGYSSSLRNVINNSNALFICAAGNSAQDTDASPYYPASYDCGNIISVAASDQNDQMAWFSNYGTVTVDVAAPGVLIYSLDNGRQTLWSDNFNDSILDGWTRSGTPGTWQIADPPGTTGAPALGSNPGADYANDADNWVKSPAQNLSSASATTLTFQLKGDSEADADYLRLEVSTNGSSWTTLSLKVSNTVVSPGYSGTLSYFTTVLADLGAWDGQSQVYLRFRFTSNSSTTGSGFFIDNVSLTASTAADVYQLMQGTSMAAGFVSGTAALVKAKYSSLTPAEIKSVIENTVDLDQDLVSYVGAGGRINANRALTLLRELSLNASLGSGDSIQLSWTSSVPLTSLISIQRRENGQMNYSTIAQVSSSETSYNDQSVSGTSTTYFYRIHAYVSGGGDGYSNEIYANIVGGSSSSLSGGGGGGGGGGCFIGSMP